MWRSRFLLVLVGFISACASLHGGASAPDTRPPVVLRLDGSALADADARAAAARALGQATRRRVEVVDDAAGEAMLRDLAARERAGLRRYDWREPRCAAHADTLAAARVGADGAYRLTLTAAPTTSRGLLDAFRSTGPVTGDAALRVFDGSGRTARIAVAGDDVAAAATVAATSLPAPSPARWEVVANGLLKAGCPFLALAVQDLRLRERKAGRAVRARALAAIAGQGAAPKTPQTASAPEPVPAGGATATAAPASDARFSCEALCGIHMVEVCNKDRSLWNQHLVAWQRTGCGARRTEPFLVECYRRQRISGTFHDACVAPCEKSPEGRAALLEMLQGAGCLRSGPS